MGAYGTATMTFSPVLTVLVVLVASAQGGIGPSSNNSFCTESKECLEYQLVCKTDEYEVRHYSPTRWVSTDAEAYFMGVGAAMAFRRLFQYITGANEEGVQMEMTTPVLVKIPEETKMWEPAVYTLNFPLPAAYQERPPKPTSDKLYFTEMPDLDVYVRSYGGWMLSVTSRLHAHLLTKELERVRAPYNRTYHYGVGYDSPLKLTNRHNEVWYIAEGEPVCTDPQEPTPAHTPTPTRTALTDSPTVAAFATALRALRDSPASQASHRASEAPPSDSAALPSGAPSSAPSSDPPTQSPSEAPRPAEFSVPFTAAQSAAEPSANSSVGPSPEPQTVSGPQNITDFQAVTGLGAVTGPQSAGEPHATVTGAQVADSQNVSEPRAVNGPQNASDSQAAAAAAAGLVSATGAQNDSQQQAVTGAQNVSEPQTATGPQNVSDPQAVTAPQTAAGTQTYSELRNDSVPWNHTTQGDQEAQASGGLVAERSDTQ